MYGRPHTGCRRIIVLCLHFKVLFSFFFLFILQLPASNKRQRFSNDAKLKGERCKEYTQKAGFENSTCWLPCVVRTSTSTNFIRYSTSTPPAMFMSWRGRTCSYRRHRNEGNGFLDGSSGFDCNLKKKGDSYTLFPRNLSRKDGYCQEAGSMLDEVATWILRHSNRLQTRMCVKQGQSWDRGILKMNGRLHH